MLMRLRKVGEEGLVLAGGWGVGPREQGGASSFRSFWLMATSLHAFAFDGLDFPLFHHVFYSMDTHLATNC